MRTLFLEILGLYFSALIRFITCEDVGEAVWCLVTLSARSLDSLVWTNLQGSSGDADIENRLVDTVEKGEGGTTN